MQLRLVVETPSVRRDVIVEADRMTTGGLFAGELARHLGLPEGKYDATCERTGSALSADAPLASAGLRQGDTVALVPRTTRPSGPAKWTPFEFAVTNGPDAETRHPLRTGDYQVGRDPARCDIVLSDLKVSAVHCRLRVTPNVVRVADLNSTNGTFVSGRRVKPTDWQNVGTQEIKIGDSVIHVRSRSALGKAPGPDGFVQFNRPPRVTSRLRATKIEIKRPPEEFRRRNLPLPMILGSLVIGGPMVLMQVVRSTPDASVLIMGAVFLLAAPLMYTWNVLDERRSDRKQYVEAESEYRARVRSAAQALKAGRASEIEWRERAFPKPSVVLEAVLDHAPSLWARRSSDADYVSLRIGTADRPAAADVLFEEGGSQALRDEGRQELLNDNVLRSIPIDVPLARINSIGIAAPEYDATTLARWMVAQAAAMHSPRDLAIAAVVAEQGVQDWDWLKWLPHTLGEGSPLRGPHLAVEGESGQSLMGSVLAVLRRRSADGLPRTPRTEPSLLLLIDGRSGVNRAVASRILEAPAESGVCTIWIGADVHELPGDCRGLIEIAKGKASWSAGADEHEIKGITLDRFSSDDAASLARALAPLRDTSADTVAAAIPRRLSLFDLLGIDAADESFVLGRWERADADISAPIGRTATAQFPLDLSRHGPHGLIAGTTGAGKSELLQTIIASLAAHHRPDHLSFLLVDYKGGAAFMDCADLPHTVGVVTDLDGHLTYRALVSLNAELKRRERILAAAGAKDLTTMAKRDPTRAPARLLIVIDEFATLVQEVPEFVEGVVDIAQRGRSLGVHLLLATQRPAGVVSAGIKANTNLRIALRVADSNDSDDVIGGSEAAAIARELPGRAYARIGHEQVVEFQAAYAGASAGVERESALSVRDFGFIQSTGRPGRRLTAVEAPLTQLKTLVRAIAAAAAKAVIPRPHAPWLPALGELVALDSVTRSNGAVPVATLGLLDDPGRQEQRPAEFDLAADGSLLIYGASGSGKTTLMRTLAVSLAKRLPPEALNLYGIDMATGGLKALEALPQCGSVIVGNEEERIVRLFAMLRSSLEHRRKVLADAKVSSVGELPEPVRSYLPRILVLLNGFGAFASAYERSTVDVLEALARVVADGRAVGIHLVVGAERRAVVPGPLAGVIQRRVILRLSDEDEYPALGLSRKQYEKVRLPPGRGFHEGLELQCAVVGEDGSSGSQAEAIVSIGEDLRKRYPAEPVWRVELLPERVDSRALAPSAEPLHAVVGILDRDFGPAHVSLRDSHFVILGPYKSGRSTALATFVESLRRATPGLMFVLLAPRPTPLTRLDCWAAAARGREECHRLAASLATTTALPGSDSTAVLVIDNGEDLLVDDDVSEALAAVIRHARGGHLRVLAAIERQAARRAYTGWFAEIKKDGAALLLQPDLEADGDLFGVRLRRGVVPLTVPGRGYLLSRGSVELVQVALTGEEARADAR